MAFSGSAENAGPGVLIKIRWNGSKCGPGFMERFVQKRGKRDVMEDPTDDDLQLSVKA